MLSCQKLLFSLDPEVHYLNGAYMSPLLQSVEEAGIRAMLSKRQPDKISPLDFFTNTERLRALFAQLVHARNADEVAIIPSTSYGIATLAKNFKADKGQKIVVLEAQFPSNVYSWMKLAQEQELELEIIPMPAQTAGRGAAWNRAILDAIDNRTALVAIEQVHWANGCVFDLKSIATKAHQHGAALIVDGTQGVGAYPIDVQDSGIDALICAGYKWLMGPYTLGYAWFGPRFITGSPIEENWINRLDSQDFSRLVDYQEAYQQGARRFDVGERSNFIAVPMGIAALEQLLAWGAENIQEYCGNMIAKFRQNWISSGFAMDEVGAYANHLFGLRIPEGLDATALQAAFKREKISVSMRGDFIRISPNVYNDEEDMEALTRLLAIGR